MNTRTNVAEESLASPDGVAGPDPASLSSDRARPILLESSDVAERLRAAGLPCSIGTVKTLGRSAELPPVAVTARGVRLYSEAEVEAYIRARRRAS